MKTAFDVRDLSDADVIDLVNTFRTSDARGSWVRALQFTRGDDAVPFARSLLLPGAEKQGYVVISALAVLARRAPKVALEDATRLLGERRTSEVHMMALGQLLQAPRPEDIDPIYDYIDRRLTRRRTSTSAGNWEIPMYIRFAAETDTLPRIAVLLERRWANLSPGERSRVDAAWPAKARTDTAAGRVREPDRGRLLEWELETNADAEATPARREATVQMDLEFMNEWLPASWKRYGRGRT